MKREGIHPKNEKENVGLGLLTVACTRSCLPLPNFFISKLKLKHKLDTFCAQTWTQLWDSTTFWESWLTNTHNLLTDKETFCKLLTRTATTVINKRESTSEWSGVSLTSKPQNQGQHQSSGGRPVRDQQVGKTAAILQTQYSGFICTHNMAAIQSNELYKTELTLKAAPKGP
jgi:hypothetical protein